jgi:hypothetical protein
VFYQKKAMPVITLPEISTLKRYEDFLSSFFKKIEQLPNRLFHQAKGGSENENIDPMPQIPLQTLLVSM